MEKALVLCTGAGSPCPDCLSCSDCWLRVFLHRHYATLYFVFCVDDSESELGILDLIQVFVETLDRCFKNVCELDLVFHMDKVCHLHLAALHCLNPDVG